MCNFRSIRGVTLLELLVTVSIAAILIGAGVPSVNNLIKSNRTSSNVADVLSALSYTRSEAITRGARVTMCIANANFDQCSSTRTWQDGWIIFVDPVVGANVTIDNTNEILRVFQGLSGAKTTLATPGLVRDKSHISYLGDGIGYDQLSGLIGTRTFVLCDDRKLTENKKYARKIIVDSRGRSRALLATDNSGGASVTKCKDTL